MHQTPAATSASPFANVRRGAIHRWSRTLIPTTRDAVIMRHMYQPESLSEYRSTIHDGEPMPWVYRMLLEASVRAGTIPERLQTKWLVRESAWTALSLGGALAMLSGYWWVGLGLMAFAVWGSARTAQTFSVRLGYCAAVEYDLGAWALQRGYLSLITIAEEEQEEWKARNRQLLESCEADCRVPPAVSVLVLCMTVVTAVTLGKLAAGILLVVNAVREPDWMTIGIGATVGAFFVLQAGVRLSGQAMALAGLMHDVRRRPKRPRRPRHGKGTEAVLAMIDELELDFAEEEEGFSLVKERLTKQIAADPAVVDAIEDERQRDGRGTRESVLSAAANAAADLLESGRFHIHRGLLDPLGPGDELTRIFEAAIDELARRGDIAKDRAEGEKAGLRRAIAEAG